MPIADATSLSPLARALFTPERLARLPARLGRHPAWRALRYAVFADHGALGRLPARTVAELRAAWLAVLGQNLGRLDRLDALVAAARADGVRVVPLKGAALCRTHWGDAGVRPMVDLDLACAPADAARLAERFCALGFRPRPRPARRLRHGAVHDLQLVDGAVWVELHFRLWHELGLPSDVAGLLARAVEVPFGPGRAWLPAPADHLFYVLVHAATHGFCGNPLWLGDAALLAAEGGAAIWREVWRLGEAHGAALPLAAAIDRLRRAFPDLAPSTAAAPARLRRLLLRGLGGWLDGADGRLGSGASRLVRPLLVADLPALLRWAAAKTALIGAGD